MIGIGNRCGLWLCESASKRIKVKPRPPFFWSWFGLSCLSVHFVIVTEEKIGRKKECERKRKNEARREKLVEIKFANAHILAYIPPLPENLGALPYSSCSVGLHCSLLFLSLSLSLSLSRSLARSLDLVGLRYFQRPFPQGPRVVSEISRKSNSMQSIFLSLSIPFPPPCPHQITYLVSAC